MSRRLLLTVDTLESRLCLSAVAFVPHPVIGNVDQVEWMEAADLNGDDLADIIVIRDANVPGRSVSNLSWLRNVDGAQFADEGQFGTTESRPNQVLLSDMDADGDVDVLVSLGPRIAVFENVDGNGEFATGEDVNLGEEVAYLNDASRADIDADGDIDVVAIGGLTSFSSEEAVWWQENLGDDSFGFPEVIGPTTFFSLRSLTVDDIDLDGKLDVAVAIDGLGSRESVIYWGRNQGNGSFSEEMFPIIAGISGPVGSPGLPRAEFGDADGDDLIDAVIASEDTLVLVSHVAGDAAEAFGLPVPPGIVADLELHDFDGDGEVEMAVPVDRSRSRISSDIFFYDRDGESFDERIIGDDISRIAVSDFDNDGDPDIFAHVFRQGFEFLENVGTDGAAAGDLDSDGEVGFQDFLLLSKNFGRTASEVQPSDGDLDDDSDVDFEDFLALARNYGQALL